MELKSGSALAVEVSCWRVLTSESVGNRVYVAITGVSSGYALCDIFKSAL